MQIQRLCDDDYYMGIAFMSMVRSGYKEVALYVDVNNIIHISTEGKQNILLSQEKSFHLDAALCLLGNFNYSGILYLTYTPCVQTILLLNNSLVKKVVYYESETVNTDVEQLCANTNLIFAKYDGNLYWMKDYMEFLRQSEIL